MQLYKVKGYPFPRIFYLLKGKIWTTLNKMFKIT